MQKSQFFQQHRGPQSFPGLGAHQLQPDTILYSTAVSACEKAGEWKVALALLAEMEDCKVEARKSWISFDLHYIHANIDHIRQIDSPLKWWYGTVRMFFFSGYLQHCMWSHMYHIIIYIYMYCTCEVEVRIKLLALCRAGWLALRDAFVARFVILSLLVFWLDWRPMHLPSALLSRVVNDKVVGKLCADYYSTWKRKGFKKTATPLTLQLGPLAKHNCGLLHCLWPKRWWCRRFNRIWLLEAHQSMHWKLGSSLGTLTGQFLVPKRHP